MDKPYQKWQCYFCADVYDEALNWPDDNITPGTCWEDVPADWLCPGCGAMKDDFYLIEN